MPLNANHFMSRFYSDCHYVEGLVPSRRPPAAAIQLVLLFALVEVQVAEVPLFACLLLSL